MEEVILKGPLKAIVVPDILDRDALP